MILWQLLKESILRELEDRRIQSAFKFYRFNGKLYPLDFENGRFILGTGEVKGIDFFNVKDACMAIENSLDSWERNPNLYVLKVQLVKKNPNISTRWYVPFPAREQREAIAINKKYGKNLPEEILSLLSPDN